MYEILEELSAMFDRERPAIEKVVPIGGQESAEWWILKAKLFLDCRQ